jgi:hypothetical protein
MDEAKMRAYEEEVARMRSQFGEQAEMPSSPRTPYGTLGSPIGLRGPGAPVMPAPQRLAELCNQLTKAGQGLAEARGRYSEARENRDVAERTFALLADQLMGAIQEHREGTPEGVPYQP